MYSTTDQAFAAYLLHHKHGTYLGAEPGDRNLAVYVFDLSPAEAEQRNLVFQQSADKRLLDMYQFVRQGAFRLKRG